MAELLLEILSEEIPARMQARAADDLKRLVCDRLKAAELAFDRAEALVTPRRLVLVVDGLPTAQPDVREEKRGPRADAPAKAIDGFLGSVGLTRAEVEERETPKGTFLYAVLERRGRATHEVLAEVVPDAMAALPWPKSMRWGAYDIRWVRPLQSIVCLFGGAVVPFSFGPVASGETTCGHRFLAPQTLRVASYADYRTQMAEARVLVDPAERRAAILKAARELAAEAGLRLKEDEGLLSEVTGLVEWPVVLMGRIDETFMAVPQEVLITSMRAHQKYFSCLNEDGSLAPRFIVVANKDAPDGGSAIVAGNERVLRARLSDAWFFWEQDHKRTLDSRVPALADMVFHARLGTVADKVARLEALAGDLARFVPGADADRARRAARLAKADLVSEMVFEFPEVQGVMGRYYALDDGEAADVAQAIAEHYAPQGPGDRCPSEPLSVAVSLADKLDSLAAFFSIDEKPTGSKDPFALRRAALGVIRLVIENSLRLPLSEAFGAALAHGWKDAYGAYFWEGAGQPAAEADDADAPRAKAPRPEAVAGELLDFFADRLKVHLKEQGVRHDLIAAVFAAEKPDGGREDDLVRLLARVAALRDFLDSDDGANLLVAYRRAANILRIEEKKDNTSFRGPADPGLLRQDEEKALFERLDRVNEACAPALEEERFADAMAVLAGLRGPVDAFFDQVTVNTEEAALRENRLRLLSQIRSALERVADFSKIEG